MRKRSELLSSANIPNRSPCMAGAAKRSPCIGAETLFFVAFKGASWLGSTRFNKVRNSSSSNNVCIFSSSGSSRFSASRSRVIGASVLMVARKRLSSMSSTFSSTFFFNAPLSSSRRVSRVGMSPNSAMSFCAVFSPTPGHPGMLSDASPMSPKRSMTCSGRSMPNFSFTRSTPITSNSLSPNLGR